MQKTSKLHLAAPWPEVKEKIKEANIELTDADLDFGEEEAMLKHLGRKMKRSKDDVKAWIESLSANKGKAS
jgi:hypothetical protein